MRRRFQAAQHRLWDVFLKWKYDIWMQGSPVHDAKLSQIAAAKWLCASQDAANGAGFARTYSLKTGWDLPYPETTGYIIPTFLFLDKRSPDLRLSERALRAGEWLTDVQFPSGAICSKTYTPTNREPSVFNTGMVLHGWTSLLEQRRHDKISSAAQKAARWIAAQQEPDGCWVRNAFNNVPHAYYTMVAWALLRYALVANDDQAHTAAVRNLDWTLRVQQSNGWFDFCSFNINEAVTTHTLAYTTQGLVESGMMLKVSKYVEAAIAASVPSLMEFQSNQRIPGTFSPDWRPTAEWECCTGNAQTSVVWQRLGAATGDPVWRDASCRLNEHMLRYQKIDSRVSEINGAIPGSWPISGSYGGFSFPNHAAKFHIDALALAG